MRMLQIFTKKGFPNNAKFANMAEFMRLDHKDMFVNANVARFIVLVVRV